MSKRLAALCFELPATTGPATTGEVPPRATITVIPAPAADGYITGIDGRRWRLSDPAAVVARHDRPRAITENHAGQLAAPQGGSSPAFGWLAGPRLQDGAIVMDVEWTPRGIAALNGRDYRYLSPEFVFDAKSGEIESIVGAALTNSPNFPQLSLNAEQHASPESSHMLKDIALALGLPETADVAACLVALNALKSERQTALNAAQHPDPTKFALREELAVALNRASSAESALAAVQAQQQDAEISAALDAALAAGKITPGAREHYLALCRTTGGLDVFKSLVAALPVIGGHTQTAFKPGSAAAGGNGLTAGQLALCSQLGIAPEKYAAELAGA